MTNEEASFILANIDRRVCDDELSDALDMAIKALEAQPCEDCISRAEAIKETKKLLRGNYDPEYIVETLKMLPPVTPQAPCEDCISRHEVFDVIERELFKWDVIDEVRKLPLVTPKAKTGRWITWKEAGNEIPSETRFECSICHDTAQTLCNGLDLLSSFCPNCGARMQEVEE